MRTSPWQRRIHRAQELSAQHPFAAEILGFYIHVARFQEGLHQHLSTVPQPPAAFVDHDLTASQLSELASRFDSFLSVAEAHGPKPLAELSRELRDAGRTSGLKSCTAPGSPARRPTLRASSRWPFFSPTPNCCVPARSSARLRPRMHCALSVIARPVSACCGRWAMGAHDP